MRHRTFAMDTCFYHVLGTYPFEARCEMLAELGYDATYVTLFILDAWFEAAWREVELLPTVQERYGLEVAAVHAVLDLDEAPNDGMNRRIDRLLDNLTGCPTVELEIRGTAKRGVDDAALDPVLGRLEPILRAAIARGLRVLLYPHVNTWLERIEQASALCRRLDHPSLGLVFCEWHWFAADGTALPERLREAAPYLELVNLSGARLREGDLPTIEALDEGELDQFPVLGLLEQVGYRGMIGVQGFYMGGDVYGKLARSLRLLRELEHRLTAHPSWGAFDFSLR